MYYIFIENNQINGCGQSPCNGDTVNNFEVSEEMYNVFNAEPDYYIWNGSEIVENPDYEEIKRQKEQAYIDSLTMTALDFITFLKSVGITDELIEIWLNMNLDVKHQLQFCQNVYCGVAKTLMPITVGDITITAEMVENAFKAKYGIT